jgi:hypothetical protein
MVVRQPDPGHRKVWGGRGGRIGNMGDIRKSSRSSDDFFDGISDRFE